MPNTIPAETPPASGSSSGRTSITKIKLTISHGRPISSHSLRGYELLSFIEKPIDIWRRFNRRLTWPVLISLTFCHDHDLRVTTGDWLQDDVRGMDDALGQIFNMNSKSHILHLKNQLQTFQKKELSVDDYVVRRTTSPQWYKKFKNLGFNWWWRAHLDLAILIYLSCLHQKKKQVSEIIDSWSYRYVEIWWHYDWQSMSRECMCNSDHRCLGFAAIFCMWIVKFTTHAPLNL